ncbi:MAG TPA: PEP-CTERM sorting domain-containing protein [Edaphobacter sp.]
MKLTRFALVAAFALTTLAAHADTFSWSLTAAGDPSLGYFPETGNGTITATQTGVTVSGATQWEISSITGTIGGNGILGLTDYLGNDNFLYANDLSLLDPNGFSVETSNGELINIFSFYNPGSVVVPGNNFGESISDQGFAGVGTFSVQAQNSPVPEPSTFLMLGTGLAGAAGVLRRRFVRS